MNKHDTEILRTLQSMATAGTLTGCFADVPISVYHHPHCPGISSTAIKSILKRSIKHYEHERTKNTAAMRFGSAFHCYVNEPEQFAATYKIIYPKSNVFVPEGMLELKDSDFKLILAMEKKLYAHPDAGPLLKDAQFELTYFAMDQETGILKKCRVDSIKNNKISDLKTCADASPSAFSYDAKKYFYRLSAAYYLEIVSQVNNSYLRDFYLIPCEYEEPHEIAVYRVDDGSIAKGEEEIRKALRLIQKVNEEGPGAWRGYPLGINDITI